MLKLAPLGSIFLIINAVIIPSRAVWPFPSKRFTANAFLDAQALGLDDVGRIVAFGDFDGDQFLDVVTLAAPTAPASEQNLLHIYTWSHSDFQFYKNSTIAPPNSNRIVNVVPADFTHDGKLDLLVMTSAGSKLDMWLFVGDGAQGFEAAPVSIPSSTIAQPIPLDVNGNLRLDMIGNVPTSRSTPNPSEESALMVWSNVWDSTNGTSLFEIVPFEQATSSSAAPKCRLGSPHSSAILDFDGDCLADLFLTCQEPDDRISYHIWLNDPAGGGFRLGQTGMLPKGAGMVSFADMDRDGTVDMVFPVCESVDSNGVGHECSINVAYNKQMGFCTAGIGGKDKEDCRRPDGLCKPDPNFKFDLSETSEIMMSIPVITLLRYSSTLPETKTTSLLMYDTTHNPPLPLPLKLGDADLDGFPEILFISVTPDDARVPKLAWNIGCTVNEPGCPPQQLQVERDDVAPPSKPVKSGSGVGGRGFVIASAVGDASVLATFRDARSVSFLDLDEDGTLDILIQRSGTGTGGSGTGNGQKVNFVQNNVFHDAFFMKAIVLNGACGGMCTPKDPHKGAYHPFGVSYSGATFKYTILDTSGKRSAAQIPQLPQTSYHALQMPYSFFGLGRTNNYIENLFVGSTRRVQKTGATAMLERDLSQEEAPRTLEVFQQRVAPPTTSDNSSTTPVIPSGEGIHYISMEGVIPNSKVVIIPPNIPGFGEWRRELYLRPGEWIPWVTVTLVVATAILGIIVYAFHWNEKREDELERRRALHSINFDAL
ncbi:hypothetical protein M408DRAFT_21755 [Serendipita vermifera MAFF 305830]|uniref:T-cell immunomodulatory protein TIP C2 domain-containing protein n=1 Tax=Serendipita vermifera MAFF 305830 TaxID=933852 RepID=A0A0C2WXV1_SERVB|nr:hypothetical protein M408DRAFT_21755 [Serendipita vermifera MAFF 305830]